VGQAGKQLTGRRQFPKERRCAENEFCRRIRKFRFARFKLELGFFLGLFAFGNLFAEVARMLAVEGVGHSLSDGLALGKGYHHPSPGNDLEERPMQTDGTGQSEDQQQFGQAHEHARTVPFPLLLSRRWKQLKRAFSR